MIKTNRELRKFGLVMFVPLALIGGLMIWRGKVEGAYWMFGAASFFLVSGLIFPKILAPIEIVWMALAKVLSVVMTYIILSLTFFIVITPIGVVMRLFGKDLLKMRLKSSQASYWDAVEVDGPASRPDKPY